MIKNLKTYLQDPKIINTKAMKEPKLTSLKVRLQSLQG